MVSEDKVKFIWIFNGSSSQFASGVFNTLALAEDEIKKNELSGVLTKYPIDILCYDYAINFGYFKPSKPHHYEAKTKQRFSPPLDHFHYENGLRD